MAPISITIALPHEYTFNWSNSFDDLESEDIENISLVLRGAIAAFSAELSYRTMRHDKKLDDYRSLIDSCAEKIRTYGLRQDDKVNIRSCRLFLYGHHERRDAQTAYEFLLLVSRVTDWSFSFLIFLALGKSRVLRLVEHQRAKLLNYIIVHSRSLSCPALNAKIRSLELAHHTSISKARKHQRFHKDQRQVGSSMISRPVRDRSKLAATDCQTENISLQDVSKLPKPSSSFDLEPTSLEHLWWVQCKQSNWRY